MRPLKQVKTKTERLLPYSMVSAAIEQIDVELTDDGDSLLFYGWTSDVHSTFIARLALSETLSEADFDHVSAEWQEIAKSLNWRLA